MHCWLLQRALLIPPPNKPALFAPFPLLPFDFRGRRPRTCQSPHLPSAHAAVPPSVPQTYSDDAAMTALLRSMSDISIVKAKYAPWFKLDPKAAKFDRVM